MLEWIPSEWRDKYAKYAEWSAWYSGDPDRIKPYYKKGIDSTFHVPVASDLASTSANLLFGEAPLFRIPTSGEDKVAEATQTRLDEIINQGDFVARLVEGAESCAVLGGVFLKPNWDYSFKSFPVLSIVQADSALPTFKWGYLTEVKFWTEVHEDSERNIYRLMEHHMTGKIYNELYKGDKHNLGQRVPLTTLEQTAYLSEEINTGLDTIAVRYVPNMKPNRIWRGSPLGVSDYCGSEGLFGALDMTYSSWIKDIRLGQGRAVIPTSWLERDDNGNLVFDTNTEVFTTLDVDPLAGQNMGVTHFQFDVRVDEHQKTSMELLKNIITTAGYSPQSFGLDINGQAESGTALNVRERKTIMTRSKKQGYWKTAIEDILEMMLTIDKELNGGNYEVIRPQVDFQDNMAFDLGQIADSVYKLNQAQALSLKTKIRMIHPDWTEQMVDEEVQTISEETGITGMEVDDIPV